MNNFKATHIVLVQGWWHGFSRGEQVRVTNEIGRNSELPFYENEEGEMYVLDESDGEVTPIIKS